MSTCYDNSIISVYKSAGGGNRVIRKRRAVEMSLSFFLHVEKNVKQKLMAKNTIKSDSKRITYLAAMFYLLDPS